ncbi:MAG: hypothetical protein JWQ29_3093, partial [Phenylobacterium sp.]|nr:hypothetical protein [Phenylobacterium sp.]
DPAAAKPETPAAPTPACPTANTVGRGAFGGPAAHLQILLTSGHLTEGWENTVLVGRPPGAAAAAGTLKFKVFTVPASGPDRAPRALPVLGVKEPDEKLLKKAGIKDATGWLELQVAGGDLESDLPFRYPYQDRILYVAACTELGTAIAAGERPITWAFFRPAQALGIASAALIYLLAAVVVWSARRHVAKINQRRPEPDTAGKAALPARAARPPRLVKPAKGAKPAPTAQRAKAAQLAKTAKAVPAPPPPEPAHAITPPLRWYTVAALKFWQCLNPVVVTADAFGRGSLAKLQILVFTMAVVGGLVMILLLKGTLLDLSSSIVLLLGLPAVGSIASQVTSNSRDRLSTSNWAWLVGRGILPVNDPTRETPSWRDIFVTNEELDLYKVQAAAFSILVLGAMMISMSKLDTFAVPESVLQVLGLSQFLLVTGRFGKPTTMADLDALITELKNREQALRTAAGTGIDVSHEGKPPDPAPKPKAGWPFKTIKAAGEQTAVPNATARYLDTAREVEVLLEGLIHRDVDPRRLLNPPLA